MYLKKIDPKHPCNKECNNRCVGCKSKCIDLLTYNVFYVEENKRMKVGSWVDRSAKSSGNREKRLDDAKRKSDMEYCLKYNSNQSNTYCIV